MEIGTHSPGKLRPIRSTGTNAAIMATGSGRAKTQQCCQSGQAGNNWTFLDTAAHRNGTAESVLGEGWECVSMTKHCHSDSSPKACPPACLCRDSCTNTSEQSGTMASPARMWLSLFLVPFLGQCWRDSITAMRIGSILANREWDSGREARVMEGWQ